MLAEFGETSAEMVVEYNKSVRETLAGIRNQYLYLELWSLWFASSLTRLKQQMLIFFEVFR